MIAPSRACVVRSKRMTGNYRRGPEDRISNMPEHLIDSILERLPVQDAVKTSILSKNWRYKWTTMMSLVFDDQFFKKYAKNGAFGRNGFIRIINKVLILHRGPISKFLLHTPNTYYMFGDSFEEVDQWMLLLSRNGVKELILTNLSQRYELPSYMFSCLQLTKLKLQYCLFKPPLEFKGFINLKDVKFIYIDFSANLCGTQINLPQLESLCLESCTNVYNFNIKATKLWCLKVFDCPDAMFLRLFRSPCLTTVSLILRKPMGNFVRAERMTLDMMLSNLPKIDGLLFNSLLFKALIAEQIPKWLPHPVNSLRWLSFRNFEIGDMNQLHGALCFLRNSPNLEFLFVDWHQLMEPQGIHYDVGPSSDHLESPHCLDCTLSKLKTVEITYLQGSRSEVLFIKLLLAHSPSLEKLSIAPSGTCDAKTIFNIAKELMRFPRASPKVEMICLDPIP